MKSFTVEGVTYRQQLIACGKRTCRRCGGTRYQHGPYWYAERWEYGRERGRVRTSYVGKRLPAELARELGVDRITGEARASRRLDWNPDGDQLELALPKRKRARRAKRG
jgi:hypothetical protein